MTERPRVAVLVPSPFVLVPVEAAVQEAGGVVERLGSASDLASSVSRVVIADLDAMAPDPVSVVQSLASQGKSVMAFSSGGEGPRLAAARRAGAVVLPRVSFLSRLPELLRLALAPAR